MQDPIAFAWGPDGKLWVVEMGDYPLGVDGKGKPGGQVKFLEDDRRRRPLRQGDRLPRRPGFPTGVLPWRKGVLVTCAPDIFYAEDTDGDGKADKSRSPLHRLRRGQPAAPRQRPRLGPRQLDLRRQRRQRRRRSRSVKTGKERRHPRPRLPLPARHRRVRGRDAARRSTAGTATTGATGSAATTRNPMLALRPRRPLPAPQPAPAPPRRRVQLARARRRAGLPVSRTLPRFNDSGDGQPLHLGVQPDRLPRRPVRPGTSPATCSSASRCTTSSTAMVLTPDGATFTRPAGRRRAAIASSSPRATTGSARR